MGWLDDCRARCKRIKYVGERMQWHARANHAGWLIATSQLLDQNHTTIPGLSFQGMHCPKAAGDIYTFAVMGMVGREKRRVLMLEVFPEHVRSHKDQDGEIFGSHVHLGDTQAGIAEHRVRAILGSLDTVSLDRWIERFRRHSRVLDNGGNVLTHPLSDSLFGT